MNSINKPGNKVIITKHMPKLNISYMLPKNVENVGSLISTNKSNLLYVIDTGQTKKSPLQKATPVLPIKNNNAIFQMKKNATLILSNKKLVTESNPNHNVRNLDHVQLSQITNENKLAPNKTQQNTLKTYSKLGYSAVGTTVSVLPRICINKNKLIKLEPVVYDDELQTPNILVVKNEVVSGITTGAPDTGDDGNAYAQNCEAQNTIETSEYENNYVNEVLNSDITINTVPQSKTTQMNIDSATDIVYEHTVNPNEVIIKNDYQHTKNSESTFSGTKTLQEIEKEKKTVSPKFDCSNSFQKHYESTLRVKKEEIKQEEYDNVADEQVQQEEDPTEIDVYYDNVDENTLEKQEHEQEVTLTWDDEKNDDDGVVAEQEEGVNNLEEVVLDETAMIKAKEMANGGLKRLTVVSPDSTFTLMIRPVPEDERSELLERLQGQNIQIPKYFTENYGQNKQKLSCHFCNKEFGAQRHLTRHLKRHKADGSWIINLTVPCEYPGCDRLFTTESKAKIHYQKVHQRDANSSPVAYNFDSTIRDRNVPCRLETCCRMFTTEKLADRHYRVIHLGMNLTATTTVKPKYECKICGKLYRSHFNLTCHMRDHTGEKPFACPDCPKRYKAHDQLKVHMRLHTGYAPFQCMACPKAFRTLAALARHDRVHTGVKPYKCPVCHKSFTQSNGVTMHLRTVHMKIPYPPRKRRRRTIPKPSVSEDAVNYPWPGSEQVDN